MYARVATTFIPKFPATGTVGGRRPPTRNPDARLNDQMEVSVVTNAVTGIAAMILPIGTGIHARFVSDQELMRERATIHDWTR